MTDVGGMTDDERQAWVADVQQGRYTAYQAEIAQRFAADNGTDAFTELCLRGPAFDLAVRNLQRSAVREQSQQRCWIAEQLAARMQHEG